MRQNRLKKRQEEILRTVVKLHIMTNRPVGSRKVAVSREERLSSATVRSLMADLETAGYLRQPHTSAGRLPTEKGYRYYVDLLMARQPLLQSEKAIVQSSLHGVRDDLPGLMEEVSRVLSRLSRQIGIVISPDITQAKFPRITFRRLEENRILAIFVDQNCQVHSCVLHARKGYRQKDLDRIGAELEDGLAGMTLKEMRCRLEEDGPAGRCGTEKVLGRDAQQILRDYLHDTVRDSAIILRGMEDIIRQPEFSDLERMRSLYRAVQGRRTLMQVLSRCTERRGIQILIGSENLTPELSEFTLVTSAYGPEDRPLGSLGILGPIRMKYGRAVSVVEYVSRYFSHLLTAAIN